MAYVDGFLLAVPREKVEAYRKMAAKGAEVWKEYGALSVAECVGDDVPYGELTSFPRAVQATDDEVVIFSWILYPSKAVRDECNAKVMADPRIQAQMAEAGELTDGKRMIFGGFETIVQA